MELQRQGGSSENVAAVAGECAAIVCQAINTFFDRATNTLPVFVSRLPSIIISILAALSILILGWIAVDYDRKQQEDAESTFRRFRWIGMLLILLLVSLIIQMITMDKVYMIDMYRKNHQHFANTFWLKEYAKAWKSGTHGIPI